ncbi:hypothetical protein [Hydrogenophaga sp. H7]|uniref:hypothetical protein n=1 Tax=Hydrogenophaga sp. H7 TaxID=1882399 RepID=UPI0009CC7DED|nr:hypothetical protein [Hydrogenophaga sp. H7]OPF62766.1 hypothetical protein BC358_11210 [Hydrogenophaga sp. H7]
MRIPVDSPAQIGAVLRLVRKTQGVRSDDLAGSAGVGPVFVLDVEKGKPTIQLGKVLLLLQEAGIKVNLEIPDNLNLDALPKGPKKRTVWQSLMAILGRNGSEAWAQSVAQSIAKGAQAELDTATSKSSARGERHD